MTPIPVFASELVEELDEQFPEKCPGSKDADRDIWIYTGKRELIRNLLLRLDMAKEMERNGGTDGK